MHESRSELEAYLEALFARARPSMLVEVRWRMPTGMARCFVDAGDLGRVARMVRRRAGSTDVFVGVLPRWRRGGGRDAVAGGARTVWVDLDAPEAARRLEAFEPAPHLAVASGGPGHVHAYWLLSGPIAPVRVERANRRLAWALGGDAQCVDAPRILRPPGTINHARHGAPVRLLSLTDRAPVALAELIDKLTDPPREAPPRPARRAGLAAAGADRVLAVAPEQYVRALTGQVVGRSRKVRCPLHEDRSPSLHVYEDPAAGWFCFGCGRGGTAYDLAAGIWGMSTDGDEFAVLRSGLQHRLGLV